MNSTLNLLPPEKRKILYNVYLLYFLEIVAELLLLYGAIVAVFLIWAGMILEDNLKEFQNKITLIEAESRTANEQIMKINEALRQANAANTAYLNWSQKIFDFSNVNRGGITLSGLDISRANDKITIQGKAANRQNLLDYQKNLAGSGLIKDLQIPVSILTAKENIDFEIKGQINLK